jgi:hypothetical protein
VWESTDLVTWTRTNGEDSGITVNQPAAGMTWAPEAYWDDALQSYVVFFASRLYSDASHTNSDNLYARMFAVLTRDFRTFTAPPASWQDTGYARIDSTVTKIGDYYYRFTKRAAPPVRSRRARTSSSSARRCSRLPPRHPAGRPTRRRRGSCWTRT